MLPLLIPIAALTTFVLPLLPQSPRPATAPAADSSADREFRAEIKGSGQAFEIEWIAPDQVKSIEAAAKEGGLADDEIVIGLTIGQASRAYPIKTIATSEAIDDELGGAPIVITWCKACHAAVIYDRRLDERTLTIGNRRNTWHGSMVLYDVETGSLWVQAIGEARAGPLRGRSLTPYVASTTTWSQWRAEHPDSTVVINDWSRGVTRATNHLFDERANLKLGILVRAGSATRFFPLTLLTTRGAVCDEIDELPIVALYSRERRVMQVFRRDVAGKAIALALAPANADAPLLLAEVGGARRWHADSGQPEPADAAWPPLARMVAYPLRLEHFRDYFPDVTVCGSALDPTRPTDGSTESGD